jgi:hypothetical protein
MRRSIVHKVPSLSVQRFLVLVTRLNIRAGNIHSGWGNWTEGRGKKKKKSKESFAFVKMASMPKNH